MANWDKINEEFFSDEAIGRRLQQKSNIDTAAKAKLEGTFGDKFNMARSLEGTFGQKTKANENLARISTAPEYMMAQYNTDPRRFKEKAKLQGIENRPAMFTARAHKDYYDFLSSDRNPEARAVSLQEKEYETKQREIADYNAGRKKDKLAQSPEDQQIAMPGRTPSITEYSPPTPYSPNTDLDSWANSRSINLDDMLQSLFPDSLGGSFTGRRPRYDY